MKKIILIMSVTILFVSCLSFKEPETENDSLIVGQFEVKFENFEDYFDIVNGVFHSGITLTFMDKSTKKEYKVYPQYPNGLFAFNAEPGGLYTLKQVDFTFRGDRYDRTVWVDFPTIMLGEIESGKVYNMAGYRWYWNGSSEYSDGIVKDLSVKHSDTYNEFESSNPESLWLEYSWINIGESGKGKK